MNAIRRNIPNCLTCLNIAAGVLAIICASRGSEPMWGLQAYLWAYIFIAIGAAADFLDGFAARLLGAYSDLGRELDSLCDVVSFGVAPAILMFHCFEHAHSVMFTADWIKWCVVLIPVCGALRLARFNTAAADDNSFTGLPVPANAIFWIGYSSLVYQGTLFMAQWYWALAAILVESLLMVSSVRLFSLKFKTWGWKGNEWRYILALTACVLVFCMGWSGLMWLILAYVLYGVFAGSNS